MILHSARADNSLAEKARFILTYEDTLVPVPLMAFPHFDSKGVVKEMCQKDISFIQPTLEKYCHDSNGVIFKVCGCYDVIKADTFYLPQGYSGDALWKDTPR
jgi:hypothetical protein